MSKRPTKASPPTPAPPDYEFNMEEIAAALFERSGIVSGLWRLAMKMRFAALTTTTDGPTGPIALPTGLVAAEGLALFKADRPGDLVFDAALLGKKRATRRQLSTTPRKTSKVAR